MKTVIAKPESKAVPQSFLNEAQRAALDAALAAKAAETKALKLQQHAKGHVNDRKPRSLKAQAHGAAKKSGCGGKFTWGSMFTDGSEALSALDRNDPNYDSEEEKDFVLKTQQYHLKAEVHAYKHQIQTIVEEYFDSADISNVAASLDEIGALDLSHYFVKRLILLAMDRKDREREMASTLLSSLYAEVIPPDQVVKGFESLVDAIDDTALDVPDAADLLATFLVRGIVDDILAPSFIQQIPETPGSLMSQVRRKAEVMLAGRHCAEKILRCWGQGAGQSYRSTKASISALLQEYLDSGDAEEAARCLRQLAVPFFHHELVRQALVAAMEGSEDAGPRVVDLLKRLTLTGEVSEVQLAKGVSRVVENLGDMELDTPGVRQSYARVAELMTVAGMGTDLAVAPTGGMSHSVQEYKLKVVVAIREYFDSQDTGEVAAVLDELAEPGLAHIFVKHAITAAMDRKDRERELVSVLLVALYPQHVDQEQLAMGFTKLLAAVDDLVLDIPEAVRLLSLFLGRAIVDELLPPSFLVNALPALPHDCLGVAVITAAGQALRSRHGAERLLSAWHGGQSSIASIVGDIRTALKEYCLSATVEETSVVIRDMGLPSFRHEVVVEALKLAFEQENQADRLITLLARMSESGEVNQTQMSKGFKRMQARLDDEELDNPHARSVFAHFMDVGTAAGWLVLEEPTEAVQ